MLFLATIEPRQRCSGIMRDTRNYARFSRRSWSGVNADEAGRRRRPRKPGDSPRGGPGSGDRSVVVVELQVEQEVGDRVVGDGLLGRGKIGLGGRPGRGL